MTAALLTVVGPVEHSVRVELYEAERDEAARLGVFDRRANNPENEWEWDRAVAHAQKQYDAAVAAWNVHAMAAWSEELGRLGI